MAVSCTSSLADLLTSASNSMGSRRMDSRWISSDLVVEAFFEGREWAFETRWVWLQRMGNVFFFHCVLPFLVLGGILELDLCRADAWSP